MDEVRTESLEFQAEVRQLLHILAHSLYTEKEIFLRELISNASDALNRVQFEMLTNREVLDPQAELAIQISFDADQHTLTVSDSGVGMTREELIENLGTIAHSGAMAFLKKLEESQRPTDLIGQFGVGFYSVFMVAEEVRVTTRSFQPEAQAITWVSGGENTYSLTPADKAERGTSVEIQLKEEAAEYASAWRLEQIIKKHSDFISFPIYLQDRIVNRQTALWRKSPQEVDEGSYTEFYRQLTLDLEPPLLHLHLVTDVPVDIHSLLYVPRQRDRGPLNLRRDYGLKLYAKNVLIQEHNQDLLPNYLRFLEGVVDSEDLPLNIARETVQSDWAVRRIQKALIGRAIKRLKELGEQQPADYITFWEQFGVFIKEGIATDPASRDELVPLLRFHSSRSGDGLVSLSDYRGRMAAGQQAIYYILGESLAAIARSPHLDYFHAHDLEVLFLADPLDGFVVQSLREFEGQPLQNVDDASLELPTSQQTPAEEPEGPIPVADFDQLLARFQLVLGERVTDVRASRVLKDSPCRLVAPEASPERDLQRLRQLLDQDFELPAKLLEVNRGHALIQKLAALVKDNPADPRIQAVIEQLYENLLLLEGLHPDPAGMIPRLETLLDAALNRP